MNKNGTKGTRYAIHWETHPNNLLKNFCSLMEHQSLVDVVICCGNNTIQAHKFVLAANSPLFREEFEKNPSIEQIIIGGCDFAVLKSVVEIMYCGQTIVSEDNVKFLVAVVKLFQMKHLENLFSEHTGSTDDIYLPKPQFLTKKPKYPPYQLPAVLPQNTCIVANIPASTAQQSCGSAQIAVAMSSAPLSGGGANILKPLDFKINVPDPMAGFKSYGRGKRTLKQQAEQACAKEAQASRMALASLQKEIAAAPQVNSFIIEDTCTETTVENFIPHAETAPYVQVLNYSDVIKENLENAMFLPVPVSQNDSQGILPKGNYTTGTYNTLMSQVNQPEKRPLTADKLKYILESHVPANVEIMYKDADGNFMPVNEEVLQNLSTKEGLQYQVVDEDGRVSEMQELQVIDKIDKIIDSAVRNPITNAEMIDISKPVLEVGDFLKDTEGALSIKDGLCSIISKAGQETIIPALVDVTQSPMKLSELGSIKPSCEVDLKFSPDMFFADIISHEVSNDTEMGEDDLFVETPKTEKIER